MEFHSPLQTCNKINKAAWGSWLPPSDDSLGRVQLCLRVNPRRGGGETKQRRRQGERAREKWLLLSIMTSDNVIPSDVNEYHNLKVNSPMAYFILCFLLIEFLKKYMYENISDYPTTFEKFT